MIEGAEKFGYTYVDTTGTTYVDSHPDAAGHIHIANKIIEALPPVESSDNGAETPDNNGDVIGGDNNDKPSVDDKEENTENNDNNNVENDNESTDTDARDNAAPIIMVAVASFVTMVALLPKRKRIEE